MGHRRKALLHIQSASQCKEQSSFWSYQSIIIYPAYKFILCGTVHALVPQDVLMSISAPSAVYWKKVNTMLDQPLQFLCSEELFISIIVHCVFGLHEACFQSHFIFVKEKNDVRNKFCGLVHSKLKQLEYLFCPFYSMMSFSCFLIYCDGFTLNSDRTNLDFIFFKCQHSAWDGAHKSVRTARL